MPKLTDRFLTSFKPVAGKKDRLAFDTECRGLGVRATAAGTRTFIVQWTDPATHRSAGSRWACGAASPWIRRGTPARARLGDVAKGIDPERSGCGTGEGRGWSGWRPC